MAGHSKFIIQQEIGESSWFGFSLLLKDKYKNQRETIVKELEGLGFECRPIVAGNFLKNKAIDFFDFEVHDKMTNATYVDKNGLFIGNHHYPIEDAIEILANY
jgi:CDP-6-deoxy-D-xylo-4-hexulose-3-dehydrase